MRKIRDIKEETKTGERKSWASCGIVAEQSSLYQEIAAERQEILRHKWMLSEHAGHDVGFNAAAYDWIAKYRTDWRKAWRKQHELPAV